MSTQKVKSLTQMSVNKIILEQIKEKQGGSGAADPPILIWFLALCGQPVDFQFIGVDF